MAGTQLPPELNEWPLEAPVAVVAWGQAWRLPLPPFTFDTVLFDHPGSLSGFAFSRLTTQAHLPNMICKWDVMPK